MKFLVGTTSFSRPKVYLIPYFGLVVVIYYFGGLIRCFRLKDWVVVYHS